MYNPNFNATVILDTVLPLIFGEDVPAPVLQLPNDDSSATLRQYRREEESLLRRWEVCYSYWKDGTEMVSVDAPSFKGETYVALHASWMNYESTSAPYLTLYAGDRIWRSKVKVEDNASLEDQARAMARAVLEAYENF